MAQKRMFSKKVTDSDKFLDLPLTAQALYFHLNMHGDDDGFVDNAKTVKRMLGASDGDLRMLIEQNFLIPFESGVVVIKDWRIHNTIKNDRYQKTVYTEEFKRLSIAENKSYREWFQNGTKVEPQIRLDKNRLDKTRLDKDRLETIFNFVEKEFGRLLSPSEIDLINDWLYKLNYKEPMIREAIKRTKLQGKNNLNYVNGILRNWKDDNITTIEQIEAKEKIKQDEVSEYDTW
ncbi:TPA: DnaD domain protein [Streptococcus agalactiae]|nr:DnaD domain protein [Streptococcus agalactiae]